MSTRTFALLFGIIFLAVGILGFGVIPQALEGKSGSGLEVEGHLLGLFHVNGIHNIVHILFGLWGLVASRSLGGAVGYFRVVAVVYALLAIMGLIPQTADGFGRVPLDGNDVYLHAVLAVIAAYFGWMNRRAAV